MGSSAPLSEAQRGLMACKAPSTGPGGVALLTLPPPNPVLGQPLPG